MLLDMSDKIFKGREFSGGRVPFRWLNLIWSSLRLFQEPEEVHDGGMEPAGKQPHAIGHKSSACTSFWYIARGKALWTELVAAAPIRF